MNSFLNSDYISFEEKYEEHGSPYKPLAEQMDTLTKINYDLLYTPNQNENELASEIFRRILGEYTRKVSIELNNDKEQEFRNHIITPQTVRGAFGTTDKFGYENIKENINDFESVMNVTNKIIKIKSQPQGIVK